MTRTTIITIIASLATITSATAQDFSGTCTDPAYKEKARCDATQWCRWTDRKAIQLPNGQQFTPTGYCGFKPGMKAGYAATVSKQ